MATSTMRVWAYGTLPQWITAGAAVIVAGMGFWFANLSGGLVQEGARPVSHAACLAYSSFVLDQHRAGLTIAQIKSLVGNADRDHLRGGDLDQDQSVGLDDEKACGTVESVIAAGPK